MLSLSLKQTGLLCGMHNSACDVLCFKIIIPGAMEEVSVIVTEPQRLCRAEVEVGWMGQQRILMCFHITYMACPQTNLIMKVQMHDLI